MATARLSLVGVGGSMFLAGSAYLATHIQHVHERVEVWQHPFRHDLVEGKGYQVAQSLFAQADGGLVRAGLRPGAARAARGHTILPAPHTDLIYAVITNEIGLFGAAALILVYLIFAYRGYKTAELANDGFSKLLAAGLTSVLALQVFVIVGGVTKLIPLTGVTLPFVSYGGSSIVANLVLLALLLVVSDHAREERARQGGRMNRQISQLFGVAAILFALLVAYTSRWTVFEAKSLENQPANRRALIKEQRIPRGLIFARDGRTRLADNKSHGSGKTRTFSRIYPTNNLFSHSVGYSFISAGRSGLEKSRNNDLVGKQNEFATIFSQLESRKSEGNDVVTTLDQRAQQTALRASAAGPARWWRSSPPPARCG